LGDFAKCHSRWGWRRGHGALRDEGWHINHKKVQRLWGEEGPKVPYRKRKKRLMGIGVQLGAMRPIAPNVIWAMDLNPPGLMNTFFRGKDDIMPKQWDRETKEKAVRLVIEHRGDYSSEWAAITTVAGRLGMSAETLRKWVRQSRVDAGQESGVTTEQAAEIRELKRKNAELEQTVAILKAATTFFARESDPRHR
jgi:transposase